MEIVIILGWAFGSAIIIALHLNRLDKRIDELVNDIALLHQLYNTQMRKTLEFDDELDNINNYLELHK